MLCVVCMYMCVCHNGYSMFNNLLNSLKYFIQVTCPYIPFPDFGWDWGPAFVPVGIWRYLGLVAFDVGLVTDVAPRVSYSDGVFGVDIWICATIPEKS